jgi:hypothetical protein
MRRRIVRRLMMLAVAVGLIAVLTPIATAGKGPRLAGSFKVVATIKDNDLGVPEGTKTNDVYKFKSTCDSGACAKVKLDRDGGNHKHYKSTLHKESPGLYKGTEGPYPYDCPGTDDARFTAKHTIEVTKARNGKAKKIGGKTNITIAGCSFGTFVKYSLKGELDN